MAQTNPSKKEESESTEAQTTNPFRQSEKRELTPELESLVHVLKPGIICDTDRRGHATPRGMPPGTLVLDATEGFIPLWARDTILRWRFRERSMSIFANPEAAKDGIRDLLAQAILAWGTAAPVRFHYDEDLWDFEIVMRGVDQCDVYGRCVLASAFFPDAGRHDLTLYPKVFTQSTEEQVDTFVHEIGHVFGLRHFFAQIEESALPSEIWGVHDKFSIMNYGALSQLTDTDKDDLRLLYQLVWTGRLTHINGTPIRLVKPYSSLAPARDPVFALGWPQMAFQPLSSVPYLGRT